MSQWTRRRFLKSSAAAGAAVTLSASSYGRVVGANADIRLACVGLKGRGNGHINGFHRLDGVRVVALCDVDRKVLEERARPFQARAEKVDLYRDLRDVLERADVDAIAIATPNHLHALQAIWSIEAGKHVYVEKPVSHNVWEGRQIVNAARRHRKVVQCGTQSRSSPGMQQAIAWVQAGNLGRILCVRGLCYKPRQSIGKVQRATVVPDSIDYDLWCGPAPKKPLMRARLHYDWHWVFDTGNGDLGNQGIHQMDMCRWILGHAELSPRTVSIGGRVGYDDDGDTPNTMIAFHDYPGAPLIFEVRGLPRAKQFRANGWGGNMDTVLGARIGVVAYCEGGHLSIPAYSGGVAYDKDGREIKSWDEGGDHFLNFIQAVRSGDPGDLNAEILEGHLSSALCHTGNISYHLGRTASAAEIRDEVQRDLYLSEAFGRMQDHLEANGVKIADGGVRLGARLSMDPGSEMFREHPEANALLTRNYREPFAVRPVAAS